jgi:ABC-type Na+ efflux pump permease subunit
MSDIPLIQFVLAVYGLWSLITLVRGKHNAHSSINTSRDPRVARLRSARIWCAVSLLAAVVGFSPFYLWQPPWALLVFAIIWAIGSAVAYFVVTLLEAWFDERSRLK